MVLFGIYVKNFKDTFLLSYKQVLKYQRYNGLASLVLHRFGVDLSKASQTSLQEK
jgi:hypothetical protein